MSDYQDELFDYVPPRPVTRADQIFRRFTHFHLINPLVWQYFEQFTLHAISRGFEHFGAGAVYERMRWEISMKTRSEQPLKLSNDFRCYYARMFHVAHPEHDGFFRNRKLRSQDQPGFKHETPDINTDPPMNENEVMKQLRRLLGLEEE